jgi:hypothetical protein
MVEMAKYSQAGLTDEDIEVLDRIIINYAVKFYPTMEMYPDPMDYAKEIIKILS